MTWIEKAKGDGHSCLFARDIINGMGKHSDIGVIFDCDGTLIDSMEEWHSLDDRVAGRAGVTLTEEDRSFVTAATLYESSVYFHEKFGFLDSPEAVMKDIRDDMLRFYRHEAKAKPGALEFVKGLYELGVPMGIASSTPPYLLKVGLDVTGFSPYMQKILSVDDINSSKSEPLIYDTVRQSLGTEVAKTWVFEDALYAVATAKAAGYPVAAIYDSVIAGSPRDLESAADSFIMSFEEMNAMRFVEENGR